MTGKKEYRSAIRSKKLIRNAFTELLKEKKFEKITVTDIVKRAEINRSTFYAHYPDVMGVIEEIQDEVLDYSQKFLEEMDFSDFFDNPMPHLEGIMKLAEENVELYRLLSNSNVAEKQLEKLKGILIDRTKVTVNVPEKYRNSFQFEFYLRFFMGGVIDVYSQWINGELDCTFSEMIEQLSTLIVKVREDFKE